MGSTSPQIKTLISLAYSYQVRKSEKNLNQLQRQLQILSVVSDLSIFEPTCMEILEFHVCLEQLLSEADPRSPLAWKVINLFIHISRSSSVRIAMRDEIQLVPVLSQFLLSSKLAKHKSQTLQLLQELSYGIKISRKEAWVIKLIPHLVNIILECEGKTDEAEAAIITLANLCRGNVPASTICRELGERKAFLKVLLDLKSPNMKIQLLVAEIFLQMNVDNSEIFSRQMMQTLDVLFTVATDGFADHDECNLRLAKDVFEEIVSKCDLQSCLRGFNKFGKFCQSLLNYITEESLPGCVGLLFDFISSIIHLEHPDVTNQLGSLFCKALPWLPNRKCGTGCLKLFQELIIAVDDTILCSYIDDLVISLKDSLKMEDDCGVLSVKDAYWTTSLLCLVEALCSRDTSFQFKLAKVLAPPVLTSLIQSFLDVKEESIPMLYGYDLGMTGTMRSSISHVSSSLLSRSNSSDSGNDSSQRTKSLENYAEVVVRAITIVKLLSTHDPEFKVECRQMLSNPKVMQHIVCCERSSEVELVKRATNILCEESVPSENLEALIKAQKEANRRDQLLRRDDSMASDHVHKTPSSQNISFSLEVEEKVHSLISKLNGAVEKAGLKDVPLTDVMSLYEYSLAAMAHAEKSLKESLEASDSQNRQIHHRLLQSRAESERLRELLRQWEGRLQQAQIEKEAVETQVADIKNTSRKFREGLVKDKTQLEREVSSQRAELSAAKQELDGKDEIIKTMKRQISESISENKSLMEREHRLREKVSKMDEENKKTKRENDEKEKENQRLEKVVTQYKKETSELEMLIRSHEETLAEKESQIEELTKTNASLKRIQDMIHNISSVKNPK